MAFVGCTQTVYVVPACLAYIGDGLASEVMLNKLYEVVAVRSTCIIAVRLFFLSLKLIIGL